MGKLIKIDSPNAALQACDIMHKGGIIAYPTDTIYGVGCDSKNETAIKKLNKLGEGHESFPIDPDDGMLYL